MARWLAAFLVARGWDLNCGGTDPCRTKTSLRCYCIFPNAGFGRRLQVWFRLYAVVLGMNWTRKQSLPTCCVERDSRLGADAGSVIVIQICDEVRTKLLDA